MWECWSPSRFNAFTFPNISRLHFLRFDVLESPVYSTVSSPWVAAFLVPKHRESDWIFSTEYGHLQFLFNFLDIARLILIGDDLEGGLNFPLFTIGRSVKTTNLKVEMRLEPLVVALSPINQWCVSFLIYDDNFVSRRIIQRI